MSAFKGCPCLMGQELHDFACMSLCLPCPSVCMCLCNVYDVRYTSAASSNIITTTKATYVILRVGGKKRKRKKEGRGGEEE